MKSLTLILSLLLVSITYAFAQDITGKWTTVDDDGVTKTSTLEIWKEGNEYKGKVLEIFDPKEKNNICSECDEDDPRYNQKVLGMTILNKLEKVEDNLWEEGEILDPENGEIYDCKIWLDEKGNIMIRGFIGFSLIGRTQTWLKN
jgi:uncharacterized protein (DUF2147 family)